MAQIKAKQFSRYFWTQPPSLLIKLMHGGHMHVKVKQIANLEAAPEKEVRSVREAFEVFGEGIVRRHADPELLRQREVHELAKTADET